MSGEYEAETDQFTVYHTCASEPDLETARDAAPSVTHGYGWIPRKMALKDAPWFLDNGAYREITEGGVWDRQAFRDALNCVDDLPREPDFVVLPDRFGDWSLTKQRHDTYLPWLLDRGFPFYSVAQPGGSVEEMVRYAVGIGADGLFIGGPDEFKKQYADQLVMTAHDYGLPVHMGKPGKRLTWARDLGVDSVDTSTIVRNGYWDRLEKLEGSSPTREQKLSEVA